MGLQGEGGKEAEDAIGKTNIRRGFNRGRKLEELYVYICNSLWFLELQFLMEGSKIENWVRQTVDLGLLQGIG